MLTSPALLLNKETVLKNIERMAKKAKASNAVLRPHFKTHQSAEVGSWFRDFGVDCITVSSLRMAQYFADNGWKDITIAFPVNIREWKEIDSLAGKINVNILVENIEAVKFLESKLTNPAGVFIKTDTGYWRTGIDADDLEAFQKIMTELKTSRKLIFIGFLTHAGNTYHTSSVDEIKKIKTDSIRKLLALKTFLMQDFPMLQLSYGDTPSCTLCDDFNDIDELRPGNFVFYDEMQYNLGVCSREDIAVALAAPVVAKHKERNEFVIHGGAVHLSKDRIKDTDGKPFYGTVVALDGYTPDVRNIIGTITGLSQEHGIVSVNDNIPFNSINIGDMVAVLPVHSCLTANLMQGYITTKGEKISMMR
jgi:D-serine deaminase-like pyridoxal phosphate-dependent protein